MEQQQSPLNDIAENAQRNLDKWQKTLFTKRDELRVSIETVTKKDQDLYSYAHQIDVMRDKIAKLNAMSTGYVECLCVSDLTITPPHIIRLEGNMDNVEDILTETKKKVGQLKGIAMKSESEDSSRDQLYETGAEIIENLKDLQVKLEEQIKIEDESSAQRVKLQTEFSALCGKLDSLTIQLERLDPNFEG